MKICKAMIVTRMPLVGIDRIRELQDLSNPAAPFNQPDAEHCHIHDHEMQVVEGEDEDGMYCFSFCEICQAVDENLAFRSARSAKRLKTIKCSAASARPTRLSGILKWKNGIACNANTSLNWLRMFAVSKAVVFCMFVCLSGCETTTQSYWHQQGPDEVQCPDRMAGFKVMKVCRQYGPHLICKCVTN